MSLVTRIETVEDLACTIYQIKNVLAGKGAKLTSLSLPPMVWEDIYRTLSGQLHIRTKDLLLPPRGSNMHFIYAGVRIEQESP